MISVVMSVYNGSKFLKFAIKSILDQTFTDFEFIIVNDRSTDSSRSIIEAFRDKRIRIIDNIKNIGLTKSLNVGIEQAKGEYIARMDADDISLNSRLSTQYGFLNKYNEFGVVGSSVNIINDRGKVESSKYRPKREEDIKFYLIKNNPFIHSSVLIRKECFDTLGYYDESYTYSQDYELWSRFSVKYKMFNFGKIFHHWRRHPGGISSTKTGTQGQFARCIALKYIKSISSNACTLEDSVIHSLRLGKYNNRREKVDRVVEDVLRKFPYSNNARIWVYDYFKNTR